ncbi:MAG: TolC family protein [Burkholderiaceae bacterium]
MKSSGLAVAALLLAGCAGAPLDRAPASPDRPWQSPQTVPSGVHVSVARVMQAQEPEQGIEKGVPLGLPQLIDLAQRLNPQTRQAWNQARQAALAVGMVEASFLPVLSANVIGGYQRTSLPSPLVIDGNRTVDTDVSGVVPALALGWLLFDFGEREALLEGAEQVSLGANVLFNAAHQKVMRDVTDFYYQYVAARSRSALAGQALANHRKVEQAVREKLDAGVATSVELAVARQAVAEARLHVVTSQGIEKNTYLALLAAVGLSPLSTIDIALPKVPRLPRSIESLTEAAIEKALSQRPDIVAAYAAVRAAEAGVDAAQAQFMPKVYLGAVASSSRTSFDIRGLPALSQQSTTGGVLVGVTLPLYDGGMRRYQLSQARLRQQQAEEVLQTRQRDAVREMVAAETQLRSALQSYQTTQELVSAARTAYGAAFESYQQGVGSITLATEAATDVLQAHQAHADAQNAALIAAANLAFAMGAMTRAQDHWLPVKHHE